MKRLLILVAVLCLAPACFAQLTQEQKVSDFKALAGLYDKNYGPYDWKKEVFHFDLLNIDPWLDRVRDSKGDLAFYDICVRYVASLHDSHDEFILPSQYEAFLPLTADIYDGKVLIDFVDNTVLDPSVYTFTVGDELLSVDGVNVGTWIRVLQPYTVNGSANQFSKDRLAVATMLDRYQGWYTFASRIQPGDIATLVIRNQTTGIHQSFSIPWHTILLPLVDEGPVPNPKRFSAMPAGTPLLRSMKERALVARNPWHAWTGVPASRLSRPASGAALPLKQRLRQFGAKHPEHVLAGGLDPFGSLFPVFGPPPGFQLRLGAGPTDEFLSGTFPVGNQIIGFIRIPSYAPASQANAIAQFQSEITFFQQNTGGLVVDIMNNGGGDGCYANVLAQYLVPKPFQPIRLKIRATENWIQDFEITLFDAELAGASQDTIDVLSNTLEQILAASAEPRGNTGPTDALSPAACYLTGGALYPPATDSNGNNLAYTKPIVVLTNNFTLSAAEFFGATLQDASRVTVYGTRTDGGGGNVVEFNSTPYSEGLSRVTLSLGVRNHDITSPGFPSAPYIENIGVNPDVFAEYQTKDNLLNGGTTFIAGFSNTILNLILGHSTTF